MRKFRGPFQGWLLPYTPSSLPWVHSAASPASGPPPRPGTVPTRLLLLSDTHNTPLYGAEDDAHAFKEPLPMADVLLHAGDLSNSGRYTQMRTTFDVLVGATAELKLVIAGNHDMSLDPDFVATVKGHAKRQAAQEESARVRELWTGAEAKAAGIVYLEEGVHKFTLRNGASLSIYASPYSVKFGIWAFMYPEGADRWNAADTDMAASVSEEVQPEHPIPDFPNIDIVMTHGPAFEILDRVTAHRHVGCSQLTRALARVRPRLHVFGHIHEDWGAMRVDWERGVSRYLDVDTGADPDVVSRGYVGLDITGKKNASSTGDGNVTVNEAPKDTGSLAESELQWGAETLCINAAIMNSHFRPTNAPWVIDLMLPASDTNRTTT